VAEECAAVRGLFLRSGDFPAELFGHAADVGFLFAQAIVDRAAAAFEGRISLGRVYNPDEDFIVGFQIFSEPIHVFPAG
jgi:hypothetical protein